MADQRQPFRFRLPWLSAAPLPRPAVEPQPPRPTVPTQIPSQPTTVAQPPPFRPPGIAPAQPPPPSQVEAPPRPESRTTTPLPAAIEPQTSVPASPARAKTQTRPPTQTESPSRSTQQSHAASTTPSPSRTTPELPSSEPKEEPEPKAYLPLSQDLEPKTQPASETPSKRQIKSPVETTLQQGSKAAQATEAPTPPKSGAPPQQRATPPTKPEKKLKETAEKKKAVQESHEKKKKITTSPSDGKVIRTVDTTEPKDKSTYGKSLQQHSLSSGEQAPLQKEIKEDISKLVQKLTTGQSKQPMNEKPISVITLAGENKGAFMHLGSQEEKRSGSVHIRRGYKTNPDDSPDTTTDWEERSKGNHKDSQTKEDMLTKAYVNSNIQGMNNSIVFGSNVNERNPGVQLSLSHTFAEPSRHNGKPEPLETNKAEFNITPAEKLAYAPTVRRRCLRGLFLESSDSELDNPDKPRRHGCRYNCNALKKDKEVGIL